MRSYPTLFQFNVRAHLSNLSSQLGRPATLDDIADSTLNQWSASGFDWIWLVGIWQTGEAGKNVSRSVPEWRAEYARDLPDFTDDDIVGSPFAIADYTVHRDFGGPDALANMRERMRQRGLRLMLDFVPNHTALDHAWMTEHPDYYVQGSAADLSREPQNYRRLDNGRIVAYGRDPYFPGWPDTAQLNYGNPAVRNAMQEQLSAIAAQCDGVRCDMSMLILPDVFRRTWNIDTQPFWPDAINGVRTAHPGFVFIAEVYWDREWELQQQGFDFTYDKRLYDRLRDHDADSVRDHLRAGMDFQKHSARSIENHDEPRAAQVFGFGQHKAAALITYLVPGLRFFHDGQLEGRTRRASIHLRRRAAEDPNEQIQHFYDSLLACVRKAQGDWRLIDPIQAWQGNDSHRGFIAFAWERDGKRQLVAVNYTDHQGQCYVPITPNQSSGSVSLYLDLPAWGYQVLDLNPVVPA